MLHRWWRGTWTRSSMSTTTQSWKQSAPTRGTDPLALGSRALLMLSSSWGECVCTYETCSLHTPVIYLLSLYWVDIFLKGAGWDKAHTHVLSRSPEGRREDHLSQPSSISCIVFCNDAQRWKLISQSTMRELRSVIYSCLSISISRLTPWRKLILYISSLPFVYVTYFFVCLQNLYLLM